MSKSPSKITPDLITEYYERKKKSISKYIDLTQEYTIKFIEDSYTAHVFIGSDDKPTLKIEYDLIGIYNIGSSIWTWAWNMTFVDQIVTSKSLEIKSYYSTLSPTTQSSQFMERMHYLLTNGNFFITHKNIAKLLQIALFILQSEWVLPASNMPNHTTKNMIEYISIKKIIQVQK